MTEHPGAGPRRTTTVAAVAVLVFVLLALLIHVDVVDGADRRVVAGATAVTGSHPWLRSSLLTWQTLAWPTWVYLVAVVLCWIAAARGELRRGWWATGTIVVGWILGVVLKIVVHRPRPTPPHPVTHLSGWSFPSGHAVGMALACAVVLLTWWPRLGRTARSRLAVAATVLVLVTCLDRVFLGVHYPTDVVAGAALGLAVASASYAIGARASAPRVARSRE